MTLPHHDGTPAAPPQEEAQTRHLTILYRGPLASCDYDCPYCPFAKRRDTPEQLRSDRAALERFTDWVREQRQGVSVLFTPWGEGLTRSWYRRALVELSHLPRVERVAIQTNLSHRVAWTADADLSRLALWGTYHPSQVPYGHFLGKCLDLAERGVRFSVGVVGQPDHLAAARRLRADLPGTVYLWVNAAEGRVYTDAEAAHWTEIDPLFSYSRDPHPSHGLPCRTGETVVSVDGEGTVRRCHFVPTALGNLYDGSFRAALRPRPCPLDMCDCHIGYVHLEPLGLYGTFAGGILERIPVAWPRRGTSHGLDPRD
ncbi:STM4011 family radical SAM protein [Frankia sp. CNm7]|uniref:STM4011 family radical SAM protein n=1 Tax=Frankia nepalensis TaxID=1836974 RepID=A0A937RHV6_9ACTN|nr:STM4011 family radical SAM protein [Frankia nepalensis]MBL7496296.1 STM4011 family radical SAM protein [Frankia nepalensis]MBL7508507.1 STM4011 family radical SAM protein [Frankia nepalensis]MBL7520240.1 STM4011 family radical SAM protein [Frankia nepalensis]MBL7627639.1 STM4011 family radical SAM protein [Frankia nepalensis]